MSAHWCRTALCCFGGQRGVVVDGHPVAAAAADDDPLQQGGPSRAGPAARPGPSAARKRYEDAVLLTGFPTGTRKKHSTPPAPFTSPASGTDLAPDPRRTYG